MKLYSIHFIGNKDGYHNHKLLEASSTSEVCSYMESLGHTIIKIEERA